MSRYLLGDGECEEEESFSVLYPLLGDREAQQRVREASPELKHCTLLETDALACLMCPLNPHTEDEESAEDEAERHSWMLQRTITLRNMQTSGVTFPFDKVGSLDAALLQAGAAGAALYEKAARDRAADNPHKELDTSPAGMEAARRRYHERAKGRSQ